MHSHSPQINPIHLLGCNNAAVLCLHGFTGTPDCLRSLLCHLNEKGFTVFAPLLAGHGGTKETLAKTGWLDWYETALSAFEELSKKYDKIFVAGLSMGGLLTLKLALEHKKKIQGIACLATPAFLQKWVRRTLPVVMKTPLKYVYRYQPKAQADIKDPVARKNYWSVDQMPLSGIQSIIDLQQRLRLNLRHITTPTLLIHARHDSTAPYESLDYFTKNLGSTTIETVTLENSFHLITMDYEKEFVAQRVREFLEANN